MKINDIIISPILTEKATKLANSKVYSFIVNQKATKGSVKEALESLYKVKTASIRIISRKGKIKRVGRKSIAKQMPDRKIALVEVREGTISLFPQT